MIHHLQTGGSFIKQKKKIEKKITEIDKPWAYYITLMLHNMNLKIVTEKVNGEMKMYFIFHLMTHCHDLR